MFLSPLFTTFILGNFKTVIMTKKLLKGIQNLFKNLSVTLAEFAKGASYALKN